MLSKSTLSDKDMLLRIREGDKLMLVQLYDRNRHSLRNFLRQNSGDESDLDEVLQEAVIVLWQQAQKPEFGLTSKLDTLLYGIARNIWLKELRRRKRMVSNDDDGRNYEYIDENEKESNTKESTLILLKYVQKLSEACRDILHLFYFDGLDMEDIAKRLNFANADTVKAKKYQCKKKLEEMVKKDFSFEDLL